MRIRALALSAGLIMFALMAALNGTEPQASARLQTDGTPADTPDEEGTPVAADEEPTAETPDSGIVTIVLWYQQNAGGEILRLMPITSTDGVVVTRGEAEGDAQEGRIVFEESRNGGYPRIRVGSDNYFDAYPVYPGDPNSAQRWIYFNDDPVIRPATMVMQIVGIRGDYEDWFGTATFISRGGDQGGIVVLAIAPPEE
jgi:hypothetical protein